MSFPSTHTHTRTHAQTTTEYNEPRGDIKISNTYVINNIRWLCTPRKVGNCIHISLLLRFLNVLFCVCVFFFSCCK